MYIDHDKINRIAERVRLGEISYAEAAALAGGTTATTPRITSSGLDDHTLAARSLMNEFGVTELDARRAVADVGIDAYRDRIAAEDARVIAIQQAEADATYEASSEGRIQAAEKKQLAQQQKARQVVLAKVALEDSSLFGATDLEALSGDELLQAAGFVQPEDTFRAGADSMAANLAAIKTREPVRVEGGPAS